jgi:hypothetical protein
MSVLLPVVLGLLLASAAVRGEDGQARILISKQVGTADLGF